MQASICLLLVAYTAAAPAAQEAPAPAAERALECTEEKAYDLFYACSYNGDDDEYNKCIEKHQPKSDAFVKACKEEDSKFANEFTTCVQPKFQSVATECYLKLTKLGNPTSFAAVSACTIDKLPEMIHFCKTAEA